MFRDEMVSGPLAAWTHTHLFEDAAPGEADAPRTRRQYSVKTAKPPWLQQPCTRGTTGSEQVAAEVPHRPADRDDMFGERAARA